MTPWTAHRDLELVRGIHRDGVIKTATRLGVRDAEALARFDKLCPVKSLAWQMDTIKYLERVARLAEKHPCP